jgi:hypothetical protein
MGFAIRLYSPDPAAADSANIAPSVAAVDFSDAVEVSRTVGPANWFAINKRSIDGEDVSFPEEDISRVRHTDPAAIAALARDGSVLTVSYDFTKSRRMEALSQAIATGVPEGARGFFGSGARFSFGPADIVDFTEDEEGQYDVKLVAVSYFDFAISCNTYLARLDLLKASLDSVPEFVRLRDDLQSIVGPLLLHLDC